MTLLSFELTSSPKVKSSSRSSFDVTIELHFGQYIREFRKSDSTHLSIL